MRAMVDTRTLLWMMGLAIASLLDKVGDVTPLTAIGGAFVGLCIAKVTDRKVVSWFRFLAWSSAMCYVAILLYLDEATAGLLAAGIALVLASIAIGFQALVNAVRHSIKAKAL